MKKSMILLFVLISIFCKAQFSLQPRVGLNENKHAIFAMDIAYRISCLEPAVTIDAVQHNTEAAYFNFRIGFIIPAGTWNVMLIGGQSFRYMSNDKRNENYWLAMGGLRVEKHFDGMVKNSAVFLQGDYADQLQITLGVKL